MQAARLIARVVTSAPPAGSVGARWGVRKLQTTSYRAKAQLIDGKRIANDIYDELSKQVQDMVTAGRRVPHLVLVRVGGDPASGSYVKNKKKSCR